MNLRKIFLREACPTKIGGQAVLDGIMMKGEDRTAVVVRLADGRLRIRTEGIKVPRKAATIPVIRGVYIFVTTLVMGMKTLMYSAEISERYSEQEADEDGGDDAPPADVGAESITAPPKEASEGSTAFRNMIFGAVALAILFVVGIFIILPTFVVNFAGTFVDSSIALNLIEGVFRIALFVLYVLVISRMEDIANVFRYHGAEHKTIHCFENGLPLTPENAARFETLHPRCGTSFLMFVMVISLLLFSLLGWPNLAVRIASRLLLIPVIAGFSYELLKIAGKGVSPLIKILSIPGLALQYLTTKEPTRAQLIVAIAALKAVTVPAETPYIEGFCDEDGKLLAELAEQAEGERDENAPHPGADGALHRPDEEVPIS